MQKKSATATGRSLDDYERNLNLSIQWNRWMLKPIGIWPSSRDSSRIEKCTRLLLNALCYALLVSLVIPCALYTFLEAKDVYSKIKQTGPIVFMVMAIAKYYSLVVHQNDIRECVEYIERDWRNITYHKDKEIMTMNAMFGRRLITVCVLFMYSGFVFYFIVLPIKVGRVAAEDGNYSFIPMMLPVSSLVIDVRQRPINELIVFHQFLSAALVHFVTVCACSLAAAFAVHACGQMEILMSWLEHSINGRSDMLKEVDDRITSIVSQHVRILKFLTLTEKALRQVSLAEFLGCTINICLLGYYIITEWNSNNITSLITYVILLVSFTFNIFIFCFIGELVAEQCKKIGEVSYMVDWYRLQGNKKRCFILIIAMSNSSIKFTAGNMVELSFSTFGDIIKTSFAYLNVLRTMT